MNTVYQWGRKWNVHTPRAAIERHINKLHVSVSDEEVRKLIADRITEARQTEPRWTDAIARQSIAFALLVHARNRELYRRVTSGNMRP